MTHRAPGELVRAARIRPWVRIASGARALCALGRTRGRWRGRERARVHALAARTTDLERRATLSRMTIARAISLALTLGIVSACAATSESSKASSGSADSPRSLAYGYHSGISTPTQLVIRDEASWKELWKRHNNVVIPTPPLPSVDFAHDMIVVVAVGQRPTGGYGVRVRSAQRQGDKLVVEALETKPADGALVPMVLSTPYDFCVVPRFDGEVAFQVK